MGKYEKLYQKILLAQSDGNISFDDLLNLLKRLGFLSRVKGSHHILTKSEIEEIINIQSQNGKAKPYHVKQIRNLILKYKLNYE